MPCEFCTDERLLAKLGDVCLGWGRARYCPICGQDLDISRYIKYLSNAIDDMVRGRMPEIITDENGKSMVLERKPVKKDEPKKEPVGEIRNMCVDLDFIDIDKEIEMLNKHFEKRRDANEV